MGQVERVVLGWVRSRVVLWPERVRVGPLVPGGDGDVVLFLEWIDPGDEVARLTGRVCGGFLRLGFNPSGCYDDWSVVQVDLELCDPGVFDAVDLWLERWQFR